MGGLIRSENDTDRSRIEWTLPYQVNSTDERLIGFVKSDRGDLGRSRVVSPWIQERTVPMLDHIKFGIQSFHNRGNFFIAHIDVVILPNY